MPCGIISYYHHSLASHQLQNVGSFNCSATDINIFFLLYGCDYSLDCIIVNKLKTLQQKAITIKKLLFKVAYNDQVTSGSVNV
jgi:hypothetical protein